MSRTLDGTIQSPVLLKGFDTDTPLSEDQAKMFFPEYAFCLRYLALGPTPGPLDLTNREAEGILNAGLGLMAVQHSPSSGWLPTAQAGRENGINARTHAQNVGFPAGVNIWCDLEGVGAASVEDVIDYCNHWAAEVSSAGYAPGLYVGDSVVLSGDQLYHELSFAHYWQTLASPPLPTRGYQMLQHAPSKEVHGINIDEDSVQVDLKGGMVKWLVRS